MFTRDQIATLREELDDAIKTVLDKHDLTGTIGRITFGTDSFRGKLEVSRKLTAGDVIVPLGGPSEDIVKGAKFSHSGTIFTVEGRIPSGRKYDIKASRDRDGKMFKFASSDIAHRMIKSYTPTGV